MIKMKPSEKNLVVKIALFFFGLSNIFPTKISIYDQYIIPIIESDVNPADTFYLAIKILIIVFRVLIIVGTAYQLWKIEKYAKRYNCFGYKDAFYKEVQNFKS
jgi:hypothetical protein